MKQTKPAQAMELRSLSLVFDGREEIVSDRRLAARACAAGLGLALLLIPPALLLADEGGGSATDPGLEWTVAVWTTTGVAEKWAPLAAEEYCDRYAERVAKRWAPVARARKPALLRVLVWETSRVTVDVMPIGNRWDPTPLPLPTLEAVLSGALPPLSPPMSQNGYRMFLVRVIPTGDDFDKEHFTGFGTPVGAFPLPDSRKAK